MEKPCSTSDSGGTSAYNTVFIDTSLDTHLAMIVSNSDTVSDLKKKILYEHPLCFPDLGGIKIHALKVKRRGHFYHLSDSMFVKSPFDGVIKSWFLSVDASILKEQSEIQHSGKPSFGGLVACLEVRNNSSADGVGLLHYSPARRLAGIDDSSLPQVQIDQLAKEKPSAKNNTDNNCNDLSIETNNRSDSELQEKFYNKDTVTNIGGKEDNSTNGISDAQCYISTEEAPQTASVVKKKSKTKKRTAGETHNHVLEENNVSDKDTSQRDTTLLHNNLVIEGRGTVVTHDKETGSKDIADEACRISSSNTNYKSQNELLMTDVPCEENAAPGEHVMCETFNSKDAVVNVNCNMSNKEDSHRPPSKKRRKTLRNNDNGSSSKENSVRAFDSTKETSEQRITIAQCSSEDKQKGLNATMDHLSSERLKDDNLLTADPSSRKRKRKRKSSKILNHVVTTVPSSAQDDRKENPGDAVGCHLCNLEREPDAAVFLGQSIQGAMTFESCSISVKEKVCAPVEEVGENNKVPCSVGVDMSISDPGNVDSKNDPPELTAASAAKRIRISEDHHTSEAEGSQANNLDKDIEVTKNVNVIVQDHQKSGSDQIGRVSEVNELSQNKVSDAMLSVKCTPSGRDELESCSKVVFISNLLDANGNVEPGKSSKKRRKSNKTRDPITPDTKHKTSSVIGTSSTEPRETVQHNHPSYKSEKEEVLLSSVEGKEVSKTTAANTSVLANDRETDNVIWNVLESLQDISETPANTENKVEKSRKKTKRKRSSASKILPELPTEDENVSCKNGTPSIDGATETKQTSFKHQLNGSNPEPEDNVGIEANPLHAQLNPEIVNSSQVISHTPEGNNEGRPLRDLNGNFPKSGHMDEVNNKAEVACENNRTVCNDNFVPSRHQHEIVISRDMTVVKETKEAVKELKASKDRKNPDTHSNSTSADLPSSQKYEKESSGRKAQAKQSSSVELQRSLSKGEVDKLHTKKEERSGRKAQAKQSRSVELHRSLSKGEVDKLRTKKEQTEVSGIEAKAPASKTSDKVSKAAKSTRPDAVSASGKRTAAGKSKEDVTASNSTLESSKNLLPQSKRGNRHQSHVTVKKVTGNNDRGEVVNSSDHRKSLLATSGTIFKEDSDGSSDDEDGLHNSDASTRTPSDNSLSSDYSDGDSRAQQNGFYSPKGKESGRRNITKSGGVNLDTILRSSRRYKAAKITASQSQLQDTESQPVEFVPDSLADM